MTIYSLIFLGLLNLSAVEHDIHVSVCDIELKNDKIEMTLKTFIDDLQIAVGLTPGDELPEDYTSADELIEGYIQSSIIITIGGTPLDLSVKDLSASNDAVWITVSSATLPKTTKSINIDHSFLTEIYNDQTNIVNVRHDQLKKTYSLNAKKKKITYEYK